MSDSMLYILDIYIYIYNTICYILVRLTCWILCWIPADWHVGSYVEFQEISSDCASTEPYHTGSGEQLSCQSMWQSFGCLFVHLTVRNWQWHNMSCTLMADCLMMHVAKSVKHSFDPINRFTPTFRTAVPETRQPPTSCFEVGSEASASMLPILLTTEYPDCTNNPNYRIPWLH